MSSSSGLSRGRIIVNRDAASGGVVVHEAGENAEFVHLSLFQGERLDREKGDAVIVGSQSDETDVIVRVVVGENNEAIRFRVGSFAARDPETRLVDNLHVGPYEKVVVSTTRPSANILIGGVVTRLPVLR